METRESPGPGRAFTWELEEAQDRWECQVFHRNLFKRLVAMVQSFAERHGDAGLAEQATALAKRTGRVRVGPEHAWAVFENVLSRPGDTSLAERLDLARRLLATVVEEREEFRLGSSAAARRLPWALEGLVRLDRQIQEDQGVDAQLGLDNVLAEPAERLLYEAVECLHRFWSPAARQIERLVQEIVWFSAPKQESSTDPSVFGAVYLNPTPRWTVPWFVEVMLHETAHLSLYIKQSIDPLVVNAQERTHSPFRPDLRPMTGVLHATFVLTRMVHGLSLYVSSNEALPDKEGAHSLLGDIWPRLENGLETLRTKARFSPKGEELFRSFESAYAQLRGSVKVNATPGRNVAP